LEQISVKNFTVDYFTVITLNLPQYLYIIYLNHSILQTGIEELGMCN